jgi:Mycoplasma protein of unknown function, DUF285
MSYGTINAGQNIDFLVKKLGYGVAKTDANSRAASSEVYASPFLTLGTAVYQQDYLIPTYTAFGTMLAGGNTVVNNQTITNVWTVQTTNNPGSVAQATWVTGKTDWIPVAVGGQGYQVGVFVGPPNLSISSLQGSGASANGPAGTVPVPINGIANDSWFFDYQAGILNFVDQAVPTTVANTSNVIYITGAVYSGYKGVSTWANLSVAGNLNSTNGNINLINGNIYAQNYFGYGGYLTGVAGASSGNVSFYSQITPLTTNQTFYVQLSNLAVAGNSITGVNSTLAYNPSTGNLSTTNFYSTSGSIGSLVALTGFSTANARVTGGFADNFAIGANTAATGAFTTLVNSGTHISNGNIVAASGTASTTTTSGALVVVGGAGISGGLNIATTGDVSANIGAYYTFANTAISSLYTNANANTLAYLGLAPAVYVNNFSTGNARITGGFADNFPIGANTKATGAFTSLTASGTTTITGGADATSTTTGILQVNGGAGITGNLWVGGNIYAANIIATVQNQITVQDPLLYLQATGNLGLYNYDIGFYSDYTAPIYAHTGLARNVNANAWIFFSNVKSEPTATTINWADAGLIYDAVIAGNILVANTTAATSTSTGALTVKGGAGIAGSLWITNTNDVSANIGSIFNNLNSLNANVGTYENTTNANVGSIFNSLNSLNANVGTYENTTNANVGSIFNSLNSLNANVGTYENTTNANIGLLYLGNATTQANLGTYQNTTNANIGTLFLGNALTQANLGAFYAYANTSINTINANVGTLYLGNAITQANLGAYQNTTNANVGLLYLGNAITQANLGTYQNTTNANIGAIFNNLNSLNANVGSYENTTNANIGSIFNSLNSLNANVGTYENTTNANIGSIFNNLNSLNANVGTYENTTNANIGLLYLANISTQANVGTLFLSNATTQANLGTQFNNLNILNANVGSYENTTNANVGTLFLGNAFTQSNLGTQFNNLNTLNANVGAFHIYANTKIGTNTNSNLVVVATTPSTSTTTGALVVGGGVGVFGNINIGSNANVAGATVLNSTQTVGNDTFIRGKNDSTLIWARPNATYDTVVVGGSATSGTVVNGAKLLVNSTDTIMLPVGTSAQRPTAASIGTDTTGMFRYSTTAGTIEWYNGSAWASPSSSAGAITDQQFNGDGTTVIFTLSQAGTTAGAIVNINGVVQIPTLAYSVTGTTLTFTEAPAVGDVIDVRLITLTTSAGSITDSSGFNSAVASTTGITIATGVTSANNVVQWNTTGAQVTLTANISVPSAGTPTTIDTIDNTQYRSAKYVIQVTSGTVYQVMEALVISNGTTATITTYGTINTGSNLGVLSASVASGNAIVQFTAVNGSNLVRVKKDYLLI